MANPSIRAQQGRAQKGDPQAIATLLQQAFPVQPIKIAARLTASGLLLRLQSLEELAQGPTLQFLHQWFRQLQPATIEQVTVQTYRQGQSQPYWQSSLALSLRSSQAAEAIQATEVDNPPEIAPLTSHYQRLNLEPGATSVEINQAYFKLKWQLRRQGDSAGLESLTTSHEILQQTLRQTLQSPANLETEAKPRSFLEQLAKLLERQGLKAQINLKGQQLHLGLSANQWPKPRKPVAKIYTVLENLDLNRELNGEQLNPIETVFVYGLKAPKQALWKYQFAMPRTNRSQDTDLLAFDNRVSRTIIFPVLSLLAILANGIPLLQYLLRGINIWFHEFGHATVAWLAGRKAIPLPLGWTNIHPDRSLFVYLSILVLFGLLFWAGWKEQRRWPMVLAIVLAVLQFLLTWMMPERRFYVLFFFGGIGGEFYLCALLMVSFFFSLPAYFRWDFYRFPVVFAAAFTFWHNLFFWHRIDRGRAAIPWGTLWGGVGDSGGDMNQLVQYGWSSQTIIDIYNQLGTWCLVVIIGTYGYFVVKQNWTVIFSLYQRLNAR
jgi:hypothetical protein